MARRYASVAWIGGLAVPVALAAAMMGPGTPPEPADLVLANIYHAILREILEQERFFDKPWYIFSGLVGTEVDKILTQMRQLPLEVVQVLDENLWFAILARNVTIP